MGAIAGFFRFWYDFIVGDDWTVAAGVIVALGVVAWLGRLGMASWWVLPFAVVVLLLASLRRATAKAD
jgi:hypothetical protein